MKDTTLLKRCLDVLNLEAEYSDHFKRPANRCPAWYELRAELRDRLGDDRPISTADKQRMADEIYQMRKEQVPQD